MLVRCADFGIPNGAILLPGTAGKSTRRAIGLMYPYVSPRTAKIHTPITLEYRRNGKHRVFPLQKRRPCGFDSHRPLHSFPYFQRMPAH